MPKATGIWSRGVGCLPSDPTANDLVFVYLSQICLNFLELTALKDQALQEKVGDDLTCKIPNCRAISPADFLLQEPLL